AWTLNCPSCNRLVRVPDELLGRQVRCPACQNVFTTQFGEAPATTPRDQEGHFEVHTTGRAPGQGAGEYEEDNYDESPRPRRRRARQAAREAVAGPAIALMVVGGLAIGLSLVGLVLNLVLGGIMLGAQPQPGRAHQPDKAEAVGRMVGGVVGAVV